MLQSTFLTLSSGELIGYTTLTIAIIATALSSYRYLLLYMLAGMVYWLIIEILQAGITYILPLSSWHGYVTAMILSWLPLLALAMRHLHKHHCHDAEYQRYQALKAKKRRMNNARYIEHTPIYDQYRPKFY